MNKAETITGPILFLDHIEGSELHLAALFIAPKGMSLPAIRCAAGEVAVTPLAEYRRVTVHRARFTLGQGRGHYHWNGTDYPVHTDLSGDARLVYVSCNGEEVGDLDREGSERNVMWARLREEHRARPFSLMLHGGDQVYADEVTQGHPLTENWPDEIAHDLSDLDGLREHLRERFMERYAALYMSPEFAWVAARIPSLMQWDDHDICDGWGSLTERATQSAIGQAIFAAAQEAFTIFQAASVNGDLPPRFDDPQGGHLGWQVRARDLCILAPDLRSERGRHCIMGPKGWDFMRAQAVLQPGERAFLMSSVPLLGPRLSLLESLMMIVPRMQRYEDDLRDQWQSHAHRDEWRRILTLIAEMGAGGPGAGDNIVALSGEIHLATRATMPLGGGRVLHQLVASGIAHRPPPKGWARFLGALAALGDDPLPGRHVRIARIPGQPGRYVAQRNFLTLERQDGAWRANWQFEHDGVSPDLPL